MLTRLLLFFALGSALPLIAREPQFQDKTYTVYLNFPTYSVRASVLHTNGKVKPRTGYTYYWFAANAIQQTENGFDGKLLHGEYKAFYLNSALKEWGQFQNGIKTGTWKLWHANGKLAEEANFSGGLRHGITQNFDEQGRLLQNAHYRHGQLHGTVERFTNGELSGTQRYKKGKEVVPKPKKVANDSVKTAPSKPPADSTTAKKSRFVRAKKKDPTSPQPVVKPEAVPEKQPRSPLFRKKKVETPPKAAAGFRS